MVTPAAGSVVLVPLRVLLMLLSVYYNPQLQSDKPDY